MALTLYHETNYQGLLRQSEHMIEFYKTLIDNIKQNKIGYDVDWITRESKNLERILYDHYFTYAHFIKLRDVEDMWKSHTRIYAYITGEQTQTIYWEILIEDPKEGRCYAIQIPSSETSAHLSVADLIVITNKLAAKKFLKLYTHVNAAKTFNYP